MSFQATTWVIEHSQHKGSALLLLLMIANHAHSDGTNAFPSVEVLAKECRMSKRQIARILLELEKSGELGVDHSAGRKPHLYHLPLMNPDKMSSLNPDKMSSLESPTMTSRVANPDIFDTNHDISGSPYKEEQSIEPSRKVKRDTSAAGAARAEDPFYAAFREVFESSPADKLGGYGVLYQHKKADFIQLAKLKSAYNGNGALQQNWRRAIENYFSTPQTTHTLADLCTRFATFQLHALDRFGKPVQARDGFTAKERRTIEAARRIIEEEEERCGDQPQNRGLLGH